MFEHHFGLRENPFPAGHQLKFVYPSREHQEARAHLRYGIENREPFLLITGEVGTGKTTSLYDALNEWGDRVAVALITNSALSRQEMLEEICLRFGMELQPGISKPAALVMLEKHLIAVRSRGEHAVLMMDEAQNLSMDLLEEIRLLSNLEHKGDKLLQIFLVGQPELEAHLARHELRQLRQRITVHYRLNPLSPDETLGYIHHHINVAGGNGPIVFPADTCREIYRLSHGIPREINTLASSALIAAYADGSPNVTLAHLAAATHEGDFRSVLSGPATRPSESAPPPMPAPPPAAAMPQRPVPAPPPPAPAPPPMPRPRPAEGIPASVWPPLPQPSLQQPPPPMPVPPAPAPVPMPMANAMPPAQPAPVDPYAAQRRGEISKGLMAAMRRSEGPQPAPAPPPPPMAMRPQFAPPPPASPPPPAPIPFPRPSMAPAPAQAHAPMPQPQMATMPPRLRQQLQGELSRQTETEPVSPMRKWLIGVSVFASLAILLILMQRFGAIDLPFLRGAAGSRAASHGGGAGPDGALQQPGVTDPTAALIDSLKREVETAKRPTRSVANVELGHRVAAKPVEQPPPNDIPVPQMPANPTVVAPAATSGADSSSAVAVADSHFGVGVAAFLDADRAATEKDRLTKDTTLPGMVLPYKDGDATMYRVILGRWSTSADAERAATALLERGLISEAHVVPIARR